MEHITRSSPLLEWELTKFEIFLIYKIVLFLALYYLLKASQILFLDILWSDVGTF